MPLMELTDTIVIITLQYIRSHCDVHVAFVMVCIAALYKALPLYLCLCVHACMIQVEATLIGVQSGQHQVPAFAAGLGLLQPSGSPAIPHAQPPPSPPGSGDPFSLSASGNVSPLDLFGGANSSSTSGGAITKSDSRHTPGDAVSIASTALLDLTFETGTMAGVSHTSIVSDPLLQSDLMGLDFTVSSTLDTVMEDNSLPLSSTAPAADAPKPKELSPEMERMIESLPDLSFMLSKVLMFPAVLTANA